GARVSDPRLPLLAMRYARRPGGVLRFSLAYSPGGRRPRGDTPTVISRSLRRPGEIVDRGRTVSASILVRARLATAQGASCQHGPAPAAANRPVPPGAGAGPGRHGCRLAGP